MKKYRGWLLYPEFLRECREAASREVLVTPPVGAAILGYSIVHIRRLLEQDAILAWAWYEEGKFHPAEVFISSRSLVSFGLQKKRLGPYEAEKPIQAILDCQAYEQLSRVVSSGA